MTPRQEFVQAAWDCSLGPHMPRAAEQLLAQFRVLPRSARRKARKDIARTDIPNRLARRAKHILSTNLHGAASIVITLREISGEEVAIRNLQEAGYPQQLIECEERHRRHGHFQFVGALVEHRNSLFGKPEPAIEQLLAPATA